MQASGVRKDAECRHWVHDATRMKHPMRTDDFWQLIDRTRRHAAGESAALAALTAELQRAGEASLTQFEHQLRRQLAALDTLELRDIAAQLWVLPDEAWLHLRAWWVSQGRSFIERLQANPGPSLRRLAETRQGPFDPPNGELFLYCAEFARVARTRVSV